MRFFQLYSYFTIQIFRGLFFRAFVALTVIVFIFLSITRHLPLEKVIQQICSILVLAYYVVATSGSIIEKTERYSAELILSKPFTRRDIIFADFLSCVTATSILTLLLTLAITLVYGIRSHEWSTTFLAVAITLTINFTALYSFIVLSGILLKNAAVLTVLWIGYLYLGALFLEGRSEFIYQTISPHVFVRVFFDGLYYLLPQIFAVSKTVTSLLSKTTWNLRPILLTLSGGIAALVSSIYLFNREELE